MNSSVDIAITLVAMQVIITIWYKYYGKMYKKEMIQWISYCKQVKEINNSENQVEKAKFASKEVDSGTSKYLLVSMLALMVNGKVLQAVYNGSKEITIISLLTSFITLFTFLGWMMYYYVEARNVIREIQNIILNGGKE